MEAAHDQEDMVSYRSSSSTGDSGPYVSTVTKRKRTRRRHRATPVLSSSSTNSSIDFSTEMATTTTEEEDMARCLILLAQGGARASAAAPEKFTSRRFSETATSATGGKAGFYVYECKTCSKCFPTFQALGGHRASHKKPKIAAAEENRCTTTPLYCMNTSTPAVADANKLRVHECSICGAEFSSGQALGGHMRRHRPIVVASSMQNQDVQKLEVNYDKDYKSNNSNIGLALDLNLPAPGDDINSGTVGFTFAAATSALVDCHF